LYFQLIELADDEGQTFSSISV